MKDLFGGRTIESSGAPLTQERLKEILHYDPETGMWTWIKERKYMNILVGSIAGTVKSNGYLYIGIDRKQYRASRLAFLYMTGKLPPDEVDHKNRVRLYNRWSNLRLVTHSENQQNKGPPIIMDLFS
jgi:hypothetical protein